MNLNEYAKMDEKKEFVDNYIRFENQGDTKYLRFMYKSGGEKMGEDIIFHKKYWDEEAKKFVYDGEQGTPVAALEAIEYDPDGSNPRRVRWERSASFCRNVLLPVWKEYNRICDGVWKITATANPRTTDAKYSVFPVMSADTIKFPIIENVVETKPAEQKVQVSKADAVGAAPIAEPAPEVKAEQPAAPAVEEKPAEQQAPAPVAQETPKAEEAPKAAHKYWED